MLELQEKFLALNFFSYFFVCEYMPMKSFYTLGNFTVAFSEGHTCKWY